MPKILQGEVFHAFPFFFTLKPISLLWYEPFSLLTRLFHSCCLIIQQSGEIMQIKTDPMVDEKPTGVLF